MTVLPCSEQYRVNLLKSCQIHGIFENVSNSHISLITRKCIENFWISFNQIVSDGFKIWYLILAIVTSEMSLLKLIWVNIVRKMRNNIGLQYFKALLKKYLIIKKTCPLRTRHKINWFDS